ncbi:prepilin-type N-terminal cleavage/methylation domain-containing protein [Pseudobdellovibrio sp. HCB154]|uniref:type IV pilus modification PilV family protein n=1 Tax=Pseudobdellovibrio sp. HCB154 TaxID=3386277 RepID=UPI00391723A7
MGFSFLKSITSKKGFTITEVMVGVALLSITVVGGLTAFDQLNKTSIQNETKSTADDRVAEIIENIRQQPTTQILQFAEPNAILNTSNLKMGWSNKDDKPLSQCKNCPGRYGYVITPATDATSDLYLVTIWFTHTEWGSEIKKFEFLVSK